MRAPRTSFRVIRIVIETHAYTIRSAWGSNAMAIAECDEEAAAENDRDICYSVERWTAQRRWERVYHVNSAHAAAMAMIQRGPVALSVPK